MRRSGASRGGMQSAAAHAVILCPKCGKPPFRVVESWEGDVTLYMHYTKKGHVWHDVWVSRYPPMSEEARRDIDALFEEEQDG